MAVCFKQVFKLFHVCWTGAGPGPHSARQLPCRHTQQQKSCQLFLNASILLWTWGLRSGIIKISQNLPLCSLLCRSLLSVMLFSLASASERIIHPLCPVLFFYLARMQKLFSGHTGSSEESCPQPPVDHLQEDILLRFSQFSCSTIWIASFRCSWREELNISLECCFSKTDMSLLILK